jgi:hypothetical protein
MSATETVEEKKETPPRLWGLMAEYSTPGELVHAAEKVRDAGVKYWDCHTPFPVHGLDKAMGMKRTILPWLVLGGGLTGMLIAILLQWYVNNPGTVTAYTGLVSSYQLKISGKPYWSLPANIPVIFELTVLLSALTTFFGLWVLVRLPSFYHPTFTVERFRRVTDDKFFIVIEARDEKFSAEGTRELLAATHPSAIEDVMN